MKKNKIKIRGYLCFFVRVYGGGLLLSNKGCTIKYIVDVYPSVEGLYDAILTPVQ